MTSLPILLLNLDRAPERLARVTERLAAQGLSFERVPAIDARQLSPEEIAAHVDGVGYWGTLTAGEVACFLGHRRCWQTLIERGHEHAVVLEDDVVPGVAVGKLLADRSWIPADADLVKLETDLKRVRLSTNRQRRHVGHDIVRLHSSHYCTAAYLVSRQAASRLLAQTERFRDAVDEILFAERSPLCRSLVIYQASPAPFVQEHRLADATTVFDAATCIEGREAKERPKPSLAAELAADLAQFKRDLSHKALALAGRRQTRLVEFR